MRADGSRNGLVQDQVDRSCMETAEPCIGGQMVWEGQWELILHHWVHRSSIPPPTRLQATCTWSDVGISHVNAINLWWPMATCSGHEALVAVAPHHQPASRPIRRRERPLAHED